MLEVLHIGKPFDDKQPVYTIDINGEVGVISSGEAGELFPGYQFLRKVEKGLQEGCETVVLEKLRIFQKGKKKSSMRREERVQIIKRY